MVWSEDVLERDGGGANEVARGSAAVRVIADQFYIDSHEVT